MKVPVSENPSPGFPIAELQFAYVIPTSDGFEVNWQALHAFHEHRSQSRSIPLSKRRWHASQARIIASRHPIEAICGYSWLAHCAAARAASEAL